MKKADYSIASIEEREGIVHILQRNINSMIAQKKVKNEAKLRQIVAELCVRVTAGEIFTGKDFEKLVSIFNQEPPG